MKLYFLIFIFLGDYKEIADIPAYKDDNRFEIIKFPWITDRNLDKRKSYSCHEANIIEDILKSKLEHLGRGEKILLKKGVLSTRDLICLKSVKEFGETACTFDSLITLYWFTEFLVRQDLQADYKFLKSCLVKDLTCDLSHKNDCITDSNDNLYKLNILIK